MLLNPITRDWELVLTWFQCCSFWKLGACFILKSRLFTLCPKTFWHRFQLCIEGVYYRWFFNGLILLLIISFQLIGANLGSPTSLASFVYLLHLITEPCVWILHFILFFDMWYTFCLPILLVSVSKYSLAICPCHVGHVIFAHDSL